MLGIEKGACDRMAVDCGIELKSHGVVMLSLYPSKVMTELVEHMSANRQGDFRLAPDLPKVWPVFSPSRVV